MKEGGKTPQFTFLVTPLLERGGAGEILETRSVHCLMLSTAAGGRLLLLCG